jgi:hypothetical protein
MWNLLAEEFRPHCAVQSRRDVIERDAYGWNQAGPALVVAVEKDGGLRAMRRQRDPVSA